MLRILCAFNAASFLTLMLAADAGLADDKHRRYGGEREREIEVQHDDVLDALKRREIRPLSEVLAVAEKAMPGQVVGVKVKRLSGVLVYELKIIGDRGRLREIYVDAATAQIIKIE